MPPVLNVSKKVSQEEESFKSALEDLFPIAENLALHVETAQDLIAIIKLALENSGQLRLLLSQFQLQSLVK